MDSHTREMHELNAALSEEAANRTRLQLELDARELEIEQLQQRLLFSDSVSVSSNNDLDDDALGKDRAVRVRDSE